MNRQVLMANVESLRKQYVEQINEQMFEDADKTFELFLIATRKLRDWDDDENGHPKLHSG